MLNLLIPVIVQCLNWAGNFLEGDSYLLQYRNKQQERDCLNNRLSSKRQN